MFIETRLRRLIGAPAERNVSGNGTPVGLPFRSSGAKSYVEGRGSINISPLRDEEPAKTVFAKKNKKLARLARRL